MRPAQAQPTPQGAPQRWPQARRAGFIATLLCLAALLVWCAYHFYVRHIEKRQPVELALPGMAGIAAGAMAHDRRAGFLQGVLALSACEVPVLVVAACSVFSQRAVMGGLVAALVATYTLTWFLLAMGFAFELPVSAPRRTKAQMATPLAGGAAAARTFGGPVEVSSDSISTTKEA
mgnify:CR=1 FL=1